VTNPEFVNNCFVVAPMMYFANVDEAKGALFFYIAPKITNLVTWKEYREMCDAIQKCQSWEDITVLYNKYSNYK